MSQLHSHELRAIMGQKCIAIFEISHDERFVGEGMIEKRGKLAEEGKNVEINWSQLLNLKQWYSSEDERMKTADKFKRSFIFLNLKLILWGSWILSTHEGIREDKNQTTNIISKIPSKCVRNEIFDPVLFVSFAGEGGEGGGMGITFFALFAWLRMLELNHISFGEIIIIMTTTVIERMMICVKNGCFSWKKNRKLW